MGAALPFDTRTLPSPRFLVPLESFEGQRLVLIRIESRLRLSLRGSVETTQSLLQSALSNWILIGGYLGICLIVAATNFAFWLWLRETYYLYYAVFAGTVAAMALWRTGLMSALLPDIYYQFHIQIFGLAHGTSLLAGFAFAASFLPFREHSPLAWRLTQALSACGLLVILIAFLDLWAELFLYVEILCIALAIIPIIAAIRMAIRGVNRTRIYLLSFTPYNLAIFVILARNSDIAHSGPVIDHALEIGSILHLLFMTIALGSRINKAETDRRKAEHESLRAARSAEQRATEIVRTRTQELTQAKAELEEALETERRVSREQLQFIDTVSHEYRTPVAILRTNLNLLQIAQAKKAPVPAPPLARMHDAILRLTEIVEVSLRSDRITDEKLELSATMLALGQLVEEAIQLANGVYPERTITVAAHPDAVAHTVWGDPPLLKTALVNIIENALKYSAAESVVTLDLSVNGNDQITISVADEGIGISDAALPFVFDKYYRAANAMNQTGAGIGLYLVRSIIVAHGGNISLVSSSRGTTATITLPICRHGDGEA